MAGIKFEGVSPLVTNLVVFALLGLLVFLVVQRIMQFGYDKRTREIERKITQQQQVKDEAYDAFKVDEDVRKSIFEQIFEDLDTGQASDIQRITDNARKPVVDWKLVEGDPVGPATVRHEFMPSDSVRILLDAEKQVNNALRRADQTP